MVKSITEYTREELEEKIMKIKAERERTAEALKKYEEELERRKHEVPLGIPTNLRSRGSFCVSGVNTVLTVKENYSVMAELFDVLNLFHSEESAEKHAEMLLDWRKALVANAKGEPIDIEVLLPLLKKGWVAMDKDEAWYWCEDKPELYEGEGMWKDVKLFYSLFAFNVKPAEDWRKSLMECGL